MTTVYSPLVGAHFRPPAKQALEFLPRGAGLILEPEPENKYDPNAIKVLIRPGEVPESQWDRLQSALGGCGWTLEDFLAQDTIQLGFCAAGTNRKALPEGTSYVSNERVLELMSDPEHHASLAFGPAGEPLVRVEVADGG